MASSRRARLGVAAFCTGALARAGGEGYKERFAVRVDAGREGGRRPRRKAPMNRTLPPDMVAALEQLGLELTRWAQTHRDSSLAEQEQAVLSRVRVALPQLLGTVLHLSTRKLEAGGAPTPR